MTKKIRYTVRALLFNPAGDVLLFKYRNDPNIHNVGKPPMDSDYWGTVGGGMEDGESEDTAIRREIAEETGHQDITIGPMIWHRKVDLVFYGDILHVDEKYFIAHTKQTEISTAGHTQIERKFVAETRWWAPATVESTAEKIFPTVLPQHIRTLAAGAYPQDILQIDV
ncbi:MAG: NUDIX domain-containing protein [Alphaproteobacteria bacterium]|nr:NUDIX domain-containing protein [Alphaproteobacteria bacterium]